MSDVPRYEVKKLFEAVIQLPPAKRAAFLDRACVKDQNLRNEVELLLVSQSETERIYPAQAAAAPISISSQVPKSQLKSGERLLHYKIVRRIGSGGMGEVYLAEDSKLHRQVALKVLHKHLTSDNQANGRFLREAQAAAKLNHPYICTIYEISETENCNFIVMQFAEGETLAEKIENQILTLPATVDLAIQIAEALSEAHSHHIIHRDIKPGNIIVNHKGQVKVLDFGLAKINEAEYQKTGDQFLSKAGLIMGTVPYMSPEQLRGETVDERTDIFSYGVTLYEMLSGRQPFTKPNTAETISSIINDEISLEKIPSKLQPILRKCLAKDKEQRYEKALHLLKDLRDLQHSEEQFWKENSAEFANTKINAKTPAPDAVIPDTDANQLAESDFEIVKNTAPEVARVSSETEAKKFFAASVAAKSRQNKYLPLGIATVLLLLATTGWYLWQPRLAKSDSQTFDSLRPVRLTSWKSVANTYSKDYSASHDSRMIAFASTAEGARESIYIKRIGDSQDLRLTNDNHRNLSPVWSPDDRRVAYASLRDGQFGIYYVPAEGGNPILLKTIGNSFLILSSWSKDGSAIYYEYEGNLFRLNINAQTSEPLTNFASARGTMMYFDVSPDEKEIVFVNEQDGQTDLWAMPLKGDRVPERLTNDADKEKYPRWHPDGERILYTVFRDNHNQINLTYRHQSRVEQITRGDNEYQLLDISTDGTKIFYLTWRMASDIWAIDAATGEESAVVSEEEIETWATVSPDGGNLAYQEMPSQYLSLAEQDSRIAVKSLADNTLRRTINGYSPKWLADGRRLTFLRWQPDLQELNVFVADVISGEEKQLTFGGISPLVYSIFPNTRYEIGKVDWLTGSDKFAYVSRRAGIQNVETSTVGSAKTDVLTANTNPNLRFLTPVFSADGSRLAYLISDNSAGDKINSVWKIALIENGQSRELFSTNSNLRMLGWKDAGSKILVASIDQKLAVAPQKVKILEIDLMGGSRRLAELDNAYYGTLTLSPDKEKIIFMSTEAGKNKISIINSGGGAAKTLVSEPNSKMYLTNPVWSSDGKKVYFDKQEQTDAISVFDNFK